MEAAANYIMGHLDEPPEFWTQMPPAAAPAQMPPAAAPAREYPPDDAGEHAALLTPHLASVRVPGAADTVCKEECVWSFARPTSPDGLNVGLTSFYGAGGKDCYFLVVFMGLFLLNLPCTHRKIRG
eukprot:SAG31_NODE_5805_length_2320_cov_0.807294_3_plen_126_part_00